MDINLAASQLAQALSGSKEFNELKAVKNSVSQDPRIAQMLDQFRAKQETLYNSQLNQNQAQRLMDELSSDYERLSALPELHRYFAAVDNFNSLLNNVMRGVNMTLEKMLG